MRNRDAHDRWLRYSLGAMSLLGLDVGTGGSRAVVVNDDGHVVASATRDHAPFRSANPGWAEQDPHDWWRASADAMRAVLGATRGDPVRAIGLSGQMHGAVLLDAEGARAAAGHHLVRSAHRRGVSARLPSRSAPSACVELTANPALTGFTLPKLLWVRRHEPAIWSKRAHGAAAQGLRALAAHRRSRHRRGRRVGHAAVRRRPPEMVRRDAARDGHRPWLAAGRVRRTGCHRRGHLCCGGRHRSACRPAGRGWWRRPGGRRHRDGRRAAGHGERDHGHLGRRVCGHRPPRARSAGPRPHVLSRRARTLARDGRDAGRRALTPLVSRHLRRRRRVARRGLRCARQGSVAGERRIGRRVVGALSDGRAHAASGPRRARRARRAGRVAHPCPRRSRDPRRAWRSVSATRSRSCRRCRCRSIGWSSAAAAPARRCGDRFRPTSWACRWARCAPKRARHSERRCLRAWAPVCGRPSRPRASGRSRQRETRGPTRRTSR